MFTPSKYQEDIFNNIKLGQNNIVINAVAGSGKTSTIIKSMDLINKDKKIIFIAFNKDIVHELNERIGNCNKNVRIYTYHSLGYSILLENNKDIKEDIKLDVFKYDSFIKSYINENGFNQIVIDNKTKYNLYIKNIISLINYARFNHSQSKREIGRLITKYSISILDNEIDVVLLALEWGCHHIKTIDYTDMVWIPVENDYKTKFHKYDWVFIDEAQDSSIVQQKLIERCFNRGAHFCAVGDDFQCINAWAGADSNAFNNFTKRVNTKTFDLSISYRCPRKVVELAQNFVPDIKSSEGAIEGQINYDVSLNKPSDGDMVICRNTEPLVRLYMRYIRGNKKCYIKGKDMGETLITMLEDINETELNKTMVCGGVFKELYNRLFQLRDTFVVNYGIDESEVILVPQVMSLYENIKSIEILSENLTYKSELIDKIKTIFIDNDGEGVCLTTIHKSKGLEADNVFILCPSLIPSKLAKSEWEVEAERNLEYVAITRAKKTLNYLTEENFKPITFFNNSHQLNKKLIVVEEKINGDNTKNEEIEIEINKESHNKPFKLNVLKFI